MATRSKKSIIREIQTLMAEAKSGYDAYLIPSADEHINEYLPDHLNRRQWVTGFDGSAGDCLVLAKEAWLFVDGRYHEQVDQQVDTRTLKVSKLGQKGHPSLIDKLDKLAKSKQRAKKPCRIAYDPWTLTAAQYARYASKLAPRGAKLVSVKTNLADRVWGKERPTPSNNTIYALSSRVAGKTFSQKLKAVRDALKKREAEVLPITKLDQIAWLFNLRGTDIPYNPVFIAYALITPRHAYLFTDIERLDSRARKALKGHVTLKPYTEYLKTLRDQTRKKTVLIDPLHITQGTVQAVENLGTVVKAAHPVQQLKAVKNKAEVRGMKQAHRAASVALVRAWRWIEQQRKTGRSVTEKTFADQLEACYAAHPAFKGLSFNTIPGAGANGSIVHYGTPDPKKRLASGELFLFDSGAQYLDKDWAGTTDTTRTILVGGKPKAKHRKHYTQVLKAHINCAAQIFPRGTTGAALDSITRAPLWAEGEDFLHGTGHGVGAFLNVHEGPIGIGSGYTAGFEPGMITSIEPGYYEPGWGGIRLENLNLVVETDTQRTTTGEPMLGFEPLIFVPFDTTLIDSKALSPTQLQWIRTYHRRVVQELTPLLEPAEITWLKAKCEC